MVYAKKTKWHILIFSQNFYDINIFSTFNFLKLNLGEKFSKKHTKTQKLKKKKILKKAKTVVAPGKTGKIYGFDNFVDFFVKNINGNNY